MGKLVHWRTPAEITDEVRDFCSTVVKDTKPSFVPVIPDSFATPHRCYGNVEIVVKRLGGNLQYGWYIHEDLDAFMFQATFHAVWVNLVGEMIDVSPDDEHPERIIFLPDPRRKYAGSIIPNRHQPRSDEPVLEKLTRFIQWEGELKKKHDPNRASTGLEVTDALAIEHERRRAQLELGLEELRRKRQPL